MIDPTLIRNNTAFSFDNLVVIQVCKNCPTVVQGQTEIVRLNFACGSRWKITVDSNYFRVALLESEFNSFNAHFSLKLPCTYSVTPNQYSTFYVGYSKTYNLPEKPKCKTCSIQDYSPTLIINLFNNYDSYKTKKTLQPQISKVSQKFKTLLENGNMSDALLIVGDTEFPVHKIVLATQSPVFYAMFNTDMKEKKENRVKIDDVDPEVMKQLLVYVYTGAIDADNVNDDQAINLLKAADKYALHELKFICAKIISKNLTIDNVFPIISMAEQYKANYLKKMAAYFILCNFDGIFRYTNDLDLTNSICDEKNDVTET